MASSLLLDTASPLNCSPRSLRCQTVPEVIISDRKTVEQSLDIARRFLETTGRAILSRIHPALESRLTPEFEGQPELEWFCRVPALQTSDRARSDRTEAGGGRIGLIEAGTSVIPYAEAAALICRDMGCEVHNSYDAGVAGLHRLWKPLHHLLN